MSIVIKNVPGEFKTKQVIKDGELYAVYFFDRHREVLNGRTIYNFAGQVTYADGHVVDISYYSWAADVARDFRNGSL